MGAVRSRDPRSGAVLLQHNVAPGVTLNSPTTSWSTDPRVAENFALRPHNTPGVVITAEVPVRRTVQSSNSWTIVHITTSEQMPESELQVRGVVRGTVRHVP